MFIDQLVTLFTSKIVPLFFTMFGFGFIIAFHEFGHFIMCKLFGVYTPTFSIGFGPTFLEKKIGQTVFRIAPIPLGGYCEIAESHLDAEPGEYEVTLTKDNTLDGKAYWQKLLVMLGGIACNMFFAYAVFSGIYYFGLPKEEGYVKIMSVEKDSVAHKAGFLKGDIILGINGTSISKDNVIEDVQTILLPTLAQNPDSQVFISVRRSDKLITVPVTLGSRMQSGKKIGFLGTPLNFDLSEVEGEYTYYPLIESIQMGIKRTHGYVRQMFGFLKSLVVRRSLAGAGGPIMMLSMTFNMAQKGVRLLLTLLAILSINLAVLNIIPLGALDGGRFLMMTIESITRRKIPDNIKIGIILGFWVFFIGLTAILSYRDILAIFG